MLNLLKIKVVDTYYFFNLVYQVFKKWRKERHCPTCGAKTTAAKITVAEVTLTSGKVVPIELLARACKNNCVVHMDQQTIDLDGEQLTIDEFIYIAEKLDKRKALWYFRDLFRQTRNQEQSQPN